MKITGNMFDKNDFYSDELREQVARTFQLASNIAEFRGVLSSIREKAENLRTLFLTEDEQAENESAARAFDNKMQSMIRTTFHNLEQYQLQGWKELFDSGE